MAMTSPERLYLNSKREVVGEKDPDRQILLAAPGAAIDPMYADLVAAHLEKQGSKAGQDDGQQTSRITPVEVAPKRKAGPDDPQVAAQLEAQNAEAKRDTDAAARTPQVARPTPKR